MQPRELYDKFWQPLANCHSYSSRFQSSASGATSGRETPRHFAEEGTPVGVFSRNDSLSSLDCDIDSDAERDRRGSESQGELGERERSQSIIVSCYVHKELLCFL